MNVFLLDSKVNFRLKKRIIQMRRTPLLPIRKVFYLLLLNYTLYFQLHQRIRGVKDILVTVPVQEVHPPDQRVST